MAMEADSAAQVADLELDCQELRAMLLLSKRNNVRKELEQLLAQVEAELKQAKVKPATSSATSSTAAPAAAPVTAPAATPELSTRETLVAEAAATTPATTAAAAPKPVPVVVKSAGPWTEITTFALDLGGYDKPRVTVDVRLKGVEALPSENVTCDFTDSSFDLKVVGLDGQNYRFLRTSLDKDIVAADSNITVKKNHVIVALQKVKGDYGYDSWADLCAKGRRKPTAEKKKDGSPQDSIMNMMKDLYEDGDDNMKKIIGEAMYKAQKGEKMDPKADDMKFPGSGFDSKLPDIGE